MQTKILQHLWIIGILFLLVLAGPLASVSARTGGPETSGYVFIDSDETGGPVYSLEDISSTGTAVSLGEDAVSGPISIFPFTFFGTTYSSVYLSQNGFVSFLADQGTNTAPIEIPAATKPNAMIAAWWGDYKPLWGGKITYQMMGIAPNRYFLIEYKDMAYALLATKATFEIKLFETSNAIEVHYSSAPGYADSNGNAYPNTAGIENEAGNLGLQYYYGVEGLTSNLAVRYTPFVGVALEPSSAIGYAKAGETRTFDLNVYNWTGQADSFDLSLTPITGNWTYQLPSVTTITLAQGAGAPFPVQVVFPDNAKPADYFEFKINVISQTPNPETGESWTDTTHLIAAVPRVGYVFNQNQINFVDTQFHQDLGNPLDTTVYGQFLLSGGLSQDGKQLYGLLAGATDDQGGKMTGRVLVFNTENMSAEPVWVDVGNDASFIAQTPDGKNALVTSYEDNTLKILDIDPASPHYLTVSKTITIGTQPIRIATSPCLNKAYITNKGSNSVSIVDLTTIHSDAPVINTITGLNAPWGVIVAPTGDRAYVANYGNTRIGVIDTIQDTLMATWSWSGVSGQNPEDLDLTPDGRWIYTAGTSSILAIDTTNPTATPINIPNQASGLYSVDVFPSEFGPYAYFSNGGVQTISVLDTTTNQIIFAIPMPGAPSFTSLFKPSTSCAYAPIAAFSPTNAVGQLNTSFTFTNRSIRNPTSVDWDFGDGSEISHDYNGTHIYTTPGTYTVTLTVHNNYGSSSTSGTINFKPKASFTPSETAIDPGDTVTFNNTTTGNPTINYVWNFGDGTATSTAVSPTHTYTKIGNFTVTLTATNSVGSDTATGLVVFHPKADFSPKESIIQVGDTINFANASTGSTPLRYSWNFGDGGTSTDANPSHTYSTVGSYTVSLTTENDWGSNTSTGTVHFRPKAIFTPGLSKIQAGESVSFSNASTGEEPLDFTWDFGDNSPTEKVRNPTHIYHSIGNYVVTLTVENSFGTDTTTGKVVFPPVAAFSQSSSVIHTGESVTFTNESTGTEPLTYLWEFGDGQTSQDRDPVHQYSIAGAYTIRLTTTNEYGTSQATSQLNFAPKAVFSPTNPVIQLGQAIAFINSSTGTAPLSYLWDFGNGATSTEANPTYTYNTAGSYIVSLKVSNSFGDQTATGKVNFSPKASFTPTNAAIQLGEPITFTNTSSGTMPLSYLWDFGDGATSTETNPTHVYETVGTYTVSLKATNDYGNATVNGQVNFKPITSFTPANPVIQLGEEIAFTSTSSGTAPLSYLWDFGDGSTSTQANPRHTYLAVGAYTISLKVTNAYGNETRTGKVNFSPKADFSFSPQNDIKPAMDVTFTNQTTGTNPINCTWDFGDGSPTTNEWNTKHSYTGRGVYQVQLSCHSDLYGDDSIQKPVSIDPFKVTLSITSDAGVSRINAGEEITYQIVIENKGPDHIFDATVKDALSDWLENVHWTCLATDDSQCSANGTGNLIEDPVNIRSGGHITYTIQAVIKPGVVGSMTNTVTMVLPWTYQILNPEGSSMTSTIVVWGNIYLPLVNR
ncbi:MAG TPA: PKD domain-containing protein [Anaerolineaceae bacterium]|nr:PKD domain-containing protein [Anaerolineaceae bacterium]